ncbi:alpha/beta fold hydrolase [Jannaschia sp. LMIT008]|uniref:alpha/beta fold hydrolase n=1 Tax=Jannaschia maritima TaxID=3032585 RepID=UPI0028118D2A|nr:alpha/beta fold hydrolase [Jannaschia sp. LMIT008]
MAAPRSARLLSARTIVAALALVAMALGAWMLHRDRAGLSVERIALAGTPVTLTRPAGASDLPLVVVAHGYAGSRQMMRAFARSLARAGLAVASYDALGHGRNPVPLSGDLTRIEGATERLVEQAVAVTRAALDRPGIAGPVALLGHSMATDVVVRAAPRVDAAAVVAVSMYSEAVTPDDPARLLILSGATEARLRDAALDAVHLVEPQAVEGRTVAAGDVARRAVAVPWVGHVGVLYAAASQREAADWIAPALGASGAVAPSPYAVWASVLLAGATALAWPLAGLAGPRRPRAERLPRRTAWLVALAPVPAAFAAAWIAPERVGGLLGFAPLAAVLLVWGTVQAAILWRAGIRPAWPAPRALAVLLAWGLLFAGALDRFGASFWPTGPRLWILALLLPGTLAVMACDAALARRGGWLVRLAPRAALVATLLAAMILVPSKGVAFTVLPVLVLFWLVHGTAGHWVLRRGNAASVGLALGVWLAWAIAASTPLVAGVP